MPHEGGDQGLGRPLGHLGSRAKPKAPRARLRMAPALKAFASSDSSYVEAKRLQRWAFGSFLDQHMAVPSLLALAFAS